MKEGGQGLLHRQRMLLQKNQNPLFSSKWQVFCSPSFFGKSRFRPSPHLRESLSDARSARSSDVKQSPWPRVLTTPRTTKATRTTETVSRSPRRASRGRSRVWTPSSSGTSATARSTRPADAPRRKRCGGGGCCAAPGSVPRAECLDESEECTKTR
jgi:hypothetical protein